MRPLVVDASVWVSAADPSDTLSAASRKFLLAVLSHRERLIIPAIAPLEVACALTRRFRSAATGRSLALRLARLEHVTQVDFDVLHDAALALGTESLLGAADALYAAAARESDGLLISWDQELIQRAGAVTPEDWLATRTEP